MTKAELVAKIAKDAELTQKQAQKAINSFIEITTATLKAGDTVTLVGFGKFSTVNRAARIGRNPQTGKELKIAAKTNGKFTPGKALKDMQAKPVEITPKSKAKAEVVFSTLHTKGKLEVGQRLGPLVDKLKRKRT